MTTLAVSLFQKALLMLKNKRETNTENTVSIKRHVYKDKVCGSDVTCLTRALGLNSNSFIQ